MTFEVNQRLTFARGEIRIDRFADGWVYFCRWRDDEEIGELVRMPIDTFTSAVAAESKERP